MKRIKTIAPALLTLLLVGLGAALPRLAALAMDYQLERELTRRDDPRVSLTLSQSSSFFRALELFASDPSQVELSDGGRMTADQVKAAACEQMLLLKSLPSSSQVPAPVFPEVTPVLLASRDNPTLSGVFWRCLWDGPQGEREQLWLDDKTGLMISYQGKTALSSAGSDYYAQLALDVRGLLRANYPVDSVHLLLETEYGPVDASILDSRVRVTDDKKSISFAWQQPPLLFTMALFKQSDGLDEYFETTLLLQNGWIYLNPPSFSP